MSPRKVILITPPPVVESKWEEKCQRESMIYINFMNDGEMTVITNMMLVMLLMIIMIIIMMMVMMMIMIIIIIIIIIIVIII